jgi:hypothetical protein
MEATDLSATRVPVYQTIRHHIPDDSYFHSYCREDLKNEVTFEDTVRFLGMYGVPNGNTLRFPRHTAYSSLPGDLGKESVISSIRSKQESTIKDSQQSAK